MCVCVCLCVCVCVCVCVCACVVCVRACVRACVRVCDHVFCHRVSVCRCLMQWVFVVAQYHEADHIEKSQHYKVAAGV